MITRRGVLGLMGGLPFTRPDQHYEPPPAGIVPGARSVLTVKKITIIAGAGGGLFAYSGPPALGNLVASIAGSPGTDPFGNAYLTGITAYATLVPLIAIQVFGGVLQFATAPGPGGPWTNLGSIDSTSAGNLELHALGGHIIEAFQQLKADTGVTVTGGTTSDTLAVSSGQAVNPVATVTNTTAAPNNDIFRVLCAAAGDKCIGVRVTGDTNDRALIQTTATGGEIFFGSGSAGADISLLRSAANLLNLHTADLDIDSAGRGLRVAEGSNAKQGTATLAAGTVTVANTSVTANSRIFLTAQTSGAAPGALRVSTRTAGTSFVITSTSATDTSLVAYEIFEPG